MLIDARKIPSDKVISCDICIIGSGPVGLSLASELASSPYKVVILESGGEMPLPEQQLLNEGNVELQGPFNFKQKIDGYLTQGRVRSIGGTGNAWGGYCAPFDEFDFKKRSWIPGSGWPITKEELIPFEKRAAQWMELGNFQSEQFNKKDPPFFPSSDSVIRTKIFHRHPIRLHFKYLPEIKKSTQVDLIHHATVTHLQASSSGNKIEVLRVQSTKEHGFKVKARKVVLAAGGIENTRLLLCSNDIHKKGIGNQFNQLGAYFMEHIHTEMNMLYLNQKPTPSAFKLFDEFRMDVDKKPLGLLGVQPEFLENERLLNSYAMLKETDFEDSRLNSFDRSVIKQTPTLNKTTGTGSIYSLIMITEQMPNKESQIILDSTKDALGLPRIRINWKASELDIKSPLRTMELIGSKLIAAYGGRMKFQADLKTYLKQSYYTWPTMGGFHHMGVTRMGEDPKNGVVDANCQLFDVKNCFVAGSSVFPTAGAVNPTFTAVALAVRLADHLKKSLKG